MKRRGAFGKETSEGRFIQNEPSLSVDKNPNYLGY
jgi:hypothetical protein